MKRLLLGLLLLVLGVVVAAWLAWPRLTDLVRRRAVDVVAQALHRPVRADVLTVSLIPLRILLSGVVLGTAPKIMAEVDTIEVRLWVLASLTELRPVVSLRIESAGVNLSDLPPPSPGPAEAEHRPASFPSVRVRQLDLKRATVRFSFENAETTFSVAEASGQLDSRASTRRLSVVVGVTGIAIERDARQLALAEVRFEGGTDKHGIFASAARVRSDWLNAGLKGAGGSRYQFNVQLDGERVAAFLGQKAKGQVALEGTLSGNLANPEGDARLSIHDAAIEQHSIGDVRARLARGHDGLSLTDLDAAGQLGHLTGNLQLTTAGDLPVHADVDLHEVDVSTLLAVVGRPLEFQDRVTASAALAGSLKPLRMELNASGVVLFTKAEPAPEVATLAVHVRAEPEAIAVQCHVGQPQQNDLSVDVGMEHGQLRGRVALKAPDLAALGTLMPTSIAKLGLTGQLEAVATLSGSTNEPTVAATIASNGASLMGASVRQISGELRIQDSKLSTPGVRVDTGAGGAELTGTLALGRAAQNDWRVLIKDLDTDFVAGVAHAFTSGAVPVSGGKLNGVLAGRGSWTQVAFQGNLAATALYVLGEPISRIDIASTAELPDWTVRAAVSHTDAERLTLEGSGSGLTRAQIAVDSTPIQVASFRGASRRRATGTILIHGQISGKPLAPDGGATITASKLGWDGRQLGDLTVRATGREGEWAVRAGAFAEALTADMTVRTSGSYPYTLAARLRGLQLAQLISSDESLHVQTEGDINLSGSLNSLKTPNGSLRINRFDVTRGNYSIGAPEPIRIDAEDGRFRIRSLVLTAQGTRLSVGGSITMAGEFNVQAQGQADLVLLEFIGHPFNSARGLFTVTAHARRNPESAWDLGGRATLRGATLDLGLPLAFSDISGEFVLSGSSIHVENFAGKTGGGSFGIGGTVNLSSGPDLTWKVADVAMTPADGFEARLSGAGSMQGSWKVLTVGGTIDVLNALYDRNIQLVDLLPFFREQVKPAPRTQAPAVQVRLDLHINAPGGVYIDNNVAKVELDAKLRITGTAETPEIFGTVEFITGEVTFRQRTFNITAGSIDFRDRLRINPVLNITAESDIPTTDADYTVTVSVTGTAENPRVEFSADDPNLSENDILSLITFGKTTAQLQREGGGVSAADALALLPTGAVAGRVGKLIGVNRFEIEAAQSRNTGGIEPRVTIGKDITDQFRASVSSSFGVENQRMVQLEYRLTPRLSLLGSWEGQTQSQAGAFGGDIKFRYEFRRLPFSLLPDGSSRGNAAQ